MHVKPIFYQTLSVVAFVFNMLMFSLRIQSALWLLLPVSVTELWSHRCCSLDCVPLNNVLLLDLFML